MAGRLSKYTPDRVKRILQAISVGATKKLAAQYGGVDAETLLNWEKKYPEFKAQMLEAEGAAVVGWLAKIEKAANDGTWQAAAWKLERLHADDYGRTVSDQRHSGPDGKEPVKFTITIDRADHGSSSADFEDA